MFYGLINIKLILIIIIIIIIRSQSLTAILHLKERAINHDPVPLRQLLLPKPICALMMSDHVVEALPLPLLRGGLPKRMSFSRFLTPLLVIFPNYPRMRLSHRTAWSASVLRWRLKCWFVAQSGIPSASFTRPISQRRWFFFCHLPSMSMFSWHTA